MGVEAGTLRCATILLFVLAGGETNWEVPGSKPGFSILGFRQYNPDSPFYFCVCGYLHNPLLRLSYFAPPLLIEKPESDSPFCARPSSAVICPFWARLVGGPVGEYCLFPLRRFGDHLLLPGAPPARRLHLTQPSSCICVPLVRFFVSPSFSCSRLLRRHLPLLYSAVHLSVAASLDLPKCIRLQSGARHQSAKRPPSSLPALTPTRTSQDVHSNMYTQQHAHMHAHMYRTLEARLLVILTHLTPHSHTCLAFCFTECSL